MSKRQPLATYQGTDTSWILEFRDEGEQLLNLDTDVTAIEAKFAEDVGEAALFTLTIGSGIELLVQTGDTLGHAKMTVTSAQLGTKLGKHKWHAKSTNVAGLKKMSIPPSAFTILEVID